MSIRSDIAEYIAGRHKMTLEELSEVLTQYEVTQIKNNIHGMKFDNLLKVERDEVTTMPLYSMTPQGVEWMKEKGIKPKVETVAKPTPSALGCLVQQISTTHADVEEPPKVGNEFADVETKTKPASLGMQPINTKPVNEPSSEFGCCFHSNGTLEIRQGDTKLEFKGKQAAQVIAFIANQQPWVEWVKQLEAA